MEFRRKSKAASRQARAGEGDGSVRRGRGNGKLTGLDPPLLLGLPPPSVAIDRDITFAEYADRWYRRKVAHGLRSKRSYASNVRHLVRAFGEIKLVELHTDQVLLWLGWLRTGPIAPRTILHLHGLLRAMLEEAVELDRILDDNPADIRRSFLPAKRDAAGWDRYRAFFDHGEVERLIGDPDIAEPRRILYGLLFLTGIRLGEACGLQWTQYDPAVEPLGRITVHQSWSQSNRAVQPPKTNVTRLIPVHPVLAEMLARWRRVGWQQTFGRLPADRDLVVPRLRQDGRIDHLLTSYCWRLFHDDLEMLALRRRRLLDCRKTFLTLTIADGASRDIVQRITHARDRDIVSGYLEMVWPAMCREVAKLRIQGPRIQLSLGLDDP